MGKKAKSLALSGLNPSLFYMILQLNPFWAQG